jgi:hypothetical protein
MTRTKLLALSLAALLGASAIPALAQTADDQPPGPDQMQMSDRGPGDGQGRHHGGHGKRGGHRIMIIDVNGDGVIGDDEAANLADRMYLRIDRDGSGDVSADEFSTVRKGRGWFSWGAQDEAITEALKAKFATLDTDKDGKLTKAEFMVDAKARFAAADTDKDGKVSPWEFRSQRN